MVGFFGDAVTLTMGTGSDHSLYDVYIDGSLWQSFNGYATAAGQVDILIPGQPQLAGDGPHLLEIRNRAERQAAGTSAYRLRFKQLVVHDRSATLRTIQYTYDRLARLREARYLPGLRTSAPDADLLRREQFTFDRAGNRLSQSIALNGGAPTATNYTYNAANQIITAGEATLTYDNNGNLLNDGTNAHTWDRANRLLTMGGASHAYDGSGNRVKQTIGANVTRYLLDLQPGLAVVLAATTGATTDRYLHTARGLHAQQINGGAWQHPLQDGLGSVRSVVDSNVATLNQVSYSAYGTPDAAVGTPFAFTGEQRDSSGLQYHRARYYSPALGMWISEDPLETPNRYGYVGGNVVNATDPSGMWFWAFPSASRERLYAPDSYIGLTPSGTCKTAYAHAWIEYWLEQYNGGILATHLEFPGGQYGLPKVDAISFTNLRIGAMNEHFGGDIGSIFEIEPANPSAIVKGYAELLSKFTAVSTGILPLIGFMPQADRWNPQRDVSSFAGRPYDWISYHVTWERANRLSILDQFGPVRVDLISLGAGQYIGEIDDAYWILMPTPGLILYVSECELRRRGAEVSAQGATTWIMRRYGQAREGQSTGKYSGEQPLPAPSFIVPEEPQPIDVPEELIAALVLGGVICIGIILAPEVTLPILGGGTACKLTGTC